MDQDWKRFAKRIVQVIGRKLDLYCLPLSLSPHTPHCIVAHLSRIDSLLRESCLLPHSHLWEVCYYCSHFTDKEVRIQRLSNLLKVTQLVGTGWDLNPGSLTPWSILLGTMLRFSRKKILFLKASGTFLWLHTRSRQGWRGVVFITLCKTS